MSHFKTIILFSLLSGLSLNSVAEPDISLRNLMITVKNNNQVSGTENNSGLSGGIRRGKVYVGTGKPIPPQQDGVTIRSDGLAYSTNSTTRTTSSNTEQQLRALEGHPAHIFTGESRQYTTRDAYGNIQSTEANANKGFYITARVIGDRVLLDISASNDEFNQPATRLSQDSISTQQLSTTVSGKVGEWIALGGVTLNNKTDEQALAKKITADSVTLGDISVKIVPID